MFYVSKILWGLFHPTSLILLFCIAGMVLATVGRARSGLRLFAGAVVLFLIFTFSPLSDWLISSLENHAAAMAASNLDGASGIIVLGGGLEGPVQPDTSAELDKHGGRLAETVKLAQRYPALPVIFSGGIADLFERTGTTPEAEHGRRFFERYGIRPPRLVLEGRSRNTYENAALTAKLLQPKPEQKWVLVTSAFHMPRAKALFEGQGFNILAYPVEYLTNHPRRPHGTLGSFYESLRRIDLAAKEWVGIGIYWMRGNIALS